MSSSSSSIQPRPPLLPWTQQTWSRWSSQPRMSSTPIPRTKFLLLKAPASTLYEEKFGYDRNMFTVPMYVSRLMAKKIQLGCVVDCTALDLEQFEPLSEAAKNVKSKVANWGPSVRYFHNPAEWDDYDVEYHRLVPPVTTTTSSSSTTTVVPHISILSKFLSICTTHWKNRPNTYIAIFDARAGMGVASYLSCVYMCDKMKAPVHAALASVEKVLEPFGLCDVVLGRDLQRRFRGRREVRMLGCVPDWWWAVEDEEDEDDDDNNENDDKDGEQGKKRERNKDKDQTVTIPPFDQMEQNETSTSSSTTTTKTNNGVGPQNKRLKPNNQPTTTNKYPDIPGLQKLQPSDAKYIRAMTVLKQLTPDYPHATTTPPQKIPTCKECNIDSTDKLKHVKRGRYKVTWRSKGRRGLLLILTEAVYFIEEGSSSATTTDDGGGVCISHVKGGMHFPQPTDLSQKQHRTLLDGILVHDSEPPSSHNSSNLVPRFLAFDIVCHSGGILTSKPYSSRMKYLWDGVLQARKRLTGKYDYSKEVLKIRGKELFELEQVKFVLEDVRKNLSHGMDGVVFVPLLSRYYGTREDGEDPKHDVVLLWSDGGGSGVGEDELVQCVESNIG